MAEQNDTPADKKIAEFTERVKKKAGETEPSKRKTLQLPLWPELDRAIPNHVARSSLFAPIARRNRKIHDRVEIACRDDVRMLFSGKQLDETDCDVFMQALHEAKKVPLGQPVKVNRADFLKAIGRSTGGKDYNDLHAAIQRLTFALLEIETKRYKIGDPRAANSTPGRAEGMHLISKFHLDTDANEYLLTVDTRMAALFSNREFALIDWGKRVKIEDQAAMAKWLQRLVATSDDVIQRYSVEDLKERMQYSGRHRDFIKALLRALQELERLEIIAGPRIEPSSRKKLQAVWTRL